jgi:hypothetical protein
MGAPAVGQTTRYSDQSDFCWMRTRQHQLHQLHSPRTTHSLTSSPVSASLDLLCSPSPLSQLLTVLPFSLDPSCESLPLLFLLLPRLLRYSCCCLSSSGFPSPCPLSAECRLSVLAVLSRAVPLLLLGWHNNRNLQQQ